MNNNEIYFAKVKPTAIIPSKRDEDGCYDLYACFEEDEIEIKPHDLHKFATGIATAFSSKYRIAYRERSSNTKSILLVVAGQIDSGFRGEHFAAIYNANDIPVIVSKKVNEVIKISDKIYVPYSKAICQFALEEVPVMEIKEITYEELKDISSERGMGMIGSSGK